MTDMQLDEVILVRGIGDGKGPPMAIGQDDLQILASQKLQPLALRQGQEHLDHIVIELTEPGHLGRHGLWLEVSAGDNLRGPDHQVRDWPGLAGKDRISSCDIKNGAFAFGIFNLTRLQVTDAGTTETIAAAIGKTYALTQGGIQQALLIPDLHLMP
jgi:hypothetical protein